MSSKPGPVDYYVDGCDLAGLPPDIAGHLRRMSSQNSEGPFDASKSQLIFTGIIIHNGKALAVLPKTTSENLSASEVARSTRALLGTLTKFASIQRAAELMTSDPFAESELRSIDYVGTYMFLIQDWIRNGPYRRVERVARSSHGGEINWTNTIKMVPPLFTEAGVPIYPEFVVNRSKINSSSVIAALQGWAVAQADRVLGWLHTEGGTGLLLPELAGLSTQLPMEPRAALRALHLELRGQFNIRKIRLLKAIISLIRRDENEQKGTGFFGVRNFWRVWETVCKFIVPGDIYSAEQIPQPVCLNNHGVPLPGFGARQIPDIVRTSGEICRVFDAKYYDVGKRNFPGWRDIVKQFYYAKSIGMAANFEQIENFFVFPKPLKPTSLPATVVLGNPLFQVDRESSALWNREFNPIKCVYLELYEAMEAFRKGKFLGI